MRHAYERTPVHSYKIIDFSMNPHVKAADILYGRQAAPMQVSRLQELTRCGAQTLSLIGSEVGMRKPD